jgi:hypothetical protein
LRCILCLPFGASIGVWALAYNANRKIQKHQKNGHGVVFLLALVKLLVKFSSIIS